MDSSLANSSQFICNKGHICRLISLPPVWNWRQIRSVSFQDHICQSCSFYHFIEPRVFKCKYSSYPQHKSTINDLHGLVEISGKAVKNASQTWIFPDHFNAFIYSMAGMNDNGQIIS